MPQRKTRAVKVSANAKSSTAAATVAAVKTATGRDENANTSTEKVLLSMRQIFDRAQESSIQHAQLSERLKELYDSNRQRFVDAFLVILRTVLVQQETNKFAILTCEFVASFISSVNDEEEDDGLFRSVLKLLLKSYDATSKQVRFFCCLLVGKLLARRSDATEMDASVCSAIESRMLDRLADRSTQVRVQAIHALARLQDPQRAAECAVISALTRILRSDPRYEVRRAALERIVVCRSTLSALLHRLNDVNEQVRRTAFGVLAERLNIAVLTPKRRVFVLRAACEARSPLVMDAARRCFETWERKAELNSAKKTGSGGTGADSPPVFGLVELLRRFDLFDPEESPLVERMIMLLLDGAKSDRRASLIEAIRNYLDDSNLPSMQSHADGEAGSLHLPSIEALVLWRVLVAHLKAQVDKNDADARRNDVDDDMASVSTAPEMNIIGRQFLENQLESVLPNAAIFSNFIDKVLDDLVSGTVYGLPHATTRYGEPTVTLMATTLADPSMAGHQVDLTLDQRFDAVRRGMLALKQLLLVLESCGEELNEEGTRRRVRDLLYQHALRDRRIVLFNDGELTSTLMRLARRVETRESHFIAQIGEAIAELRRPTDLSANPPPSVSVVIHREETMVVDAAQPAERIAEQPPVPEDETTVNAQSILAGPNQPPRAAPPPRAEERRRRSATLSDQLVKIADTKLRLNELREALNTAVTKQDFEAAGNLKRQLLETEQLRDELVAEFERLRRVDVNEDIEPGGAGVNAAASDTDGVTPAKRMAIGVNAPGVCPTDPEVRPPAAHATIRDSESEADTEADSDADPTLTDINEPDADGELVALNADGEMDIEAERARQRESVRGQLVHDAKNKKHKLNEASDPETLAACLTILRESLIHTRLRNLHAILRALADSLVLGCVSNADATVRRLAFHCLALAALMDAELARRHFVMFVQAYRLDSNELKLIAMQFIFDAVCLFGPQPFGLPLELQISKRQDASIIEDDDDQDADTLTTSAAQPTGADSETPGTQLYASLVRYLREPDAKLSSVAAEGLAKLLLNNRLVCADAFCSLFLTWFDPTVLLTSVSRQALATFMQTYAYCSPEYQLLVGMYSVTTLRRAMRRARDVAARRAEAENEDEEVDADDPNWDNKTIDGMADLLVRLTDTRLRYVQHKLLVDYDDNPGHDCLCECVWNEIAQERSDAEALRIWTRILSQLSVSALRRSAIDLEPAKKPPTGDAVDDKQAESAHVDSSAKPSTTSITVEQRVAVYRRWVQQARTVQKRHKQDKKVVHYLSTHIEILEHRLRAFAVLTGDTTQQSEAAIENRNQMDNVANAVQEMLLHNAEDDESSESEAESTSSEQD